MKNFALSAVVSLVAVSGCAQPASAIEPGRYCAHEEVTADTGRETFPLGDFDLIVEVSRNASTTYVSFVSKMPDSGRLLLVGWHPPVKADVEKNGDIRFSFTDNWGNEGVGSLTPTGTFAVDTVGEPSSDGGYIVRNYGTNQVASAACTKSDLSWRPVS